MQSTRRDILRMIKRYRSGKVSDSEREFIERYYAHFEKSPQDFPEKEAFENEIADFLHTHIHSEPKVFRLWPRIAAAACILVMLSAGGFFLLHKTIKQQTSLAKNDLAPGGNKAILTLSNGQQIVLNGKTGQIASQAGKKIVIAANGSIVYSGKVDNTQPVYNTLTVPIGNTRDIILPDGTEVTLDAGSSITYPVVFSGERRVAVTGQTYFKVHYDAAHPFYTTVKGTTLKDLGTEFNIDAYDSVKTTLIEGSVKVNATVLKPGQQAEGSTVREVDLHGITAWKDNDFYFRNQSIKTSMRQIARWYNVNVAYNHIDDNLKIFLDVTRTTNLSVVLKAIENTGKVKCSFDGNTITLSQPN